MPSNYKMNPLSFHQFSGMRSRDSVHPTITRVQKNMKKVFKKSMREIQSELDDYQLYRENYDFMMFSPMATRLNEKITALTAQNNELQYANRQMRMQLLEYEEHISTFMKKNGGKNGKNLRKLAKKQRQTTQVQEQDNIEEDAILSGGQDGDVIHEIPAPMTFILRNSSVVSPEKLPIPTLVPSSGIAT